MNLTRFTYLFTDLPIGNLSRGYYLNLINGFLPDSRQIGEETTGIQVLETYRQLTREQKDRIDQAIATTMGSVDYLLFIEDVQAIRKTHQLAREDYLKSKRKQFIYLSLAFVAINAHNVIQYSEEATRLLGKTYQSPTFEYLSHVYQLLIAFI